MQFGTAVGKACLTFVIASIDDAFVLIIFFAEASTSKSLTALKIVLGQYVGFTVIVAISLIGFAVSLALPAEPIGFLGHLPLLLGVWKFFDLLLPIKPDSDEEESSRIANATPVLKFALTTITQGAEIAVYVVLYYILLGVWCLVAFLITKQRHILQAAQKYASLLVPLLYLGLGMYILVESECYPRSVEQIDEHFVGNPGKTDLGIVTTLLLALIMGIMVWVKMRKQSEASHRDSDGDGGSITSVPSPHVKMNGTTKSSGRSNSEQISSSAERGTVQLSEGHDGNPMDWNIHAMKDSL